MKLHQDINAFRVLLEQIRERTGYRTDVLEKDYYVVLMLRELAEKQKAEADRKNREHPLRFSGIA